MSAEEIVVLIGTWDADTLWCLVNTLRSGTAHVVTREGREVIRLCLADLPLTELQSLEDLASNAKAGT